MVEGGAPNCLLISLLWSFQSLQVIFSLNSVVTGLFSTFIFEPDKRPEFLGGCTRAGLGVTLESSKV